MNVDGPAHQFALYRIIPHHTNFALRVRLRSPPTTRSVRMYARKDLHQRETRCATTCMSSAHPVIPPCNALYSPDQLGCGQRDGERSGGTWPDLLRQA